MKKIVFVAALVLVIGSASAFASGRVSQNGQPRAERNILSSQLPTALLADIKKDYKDYWITALSEEGKVKHPDYLLTLENADQIVQLRSDDSESWVVTSTIQKAN